MVMMMIVLYLKFQKSCWRRRAGSGLGYDAMRRAWVLTMVVCSMMMM